MSEIVYDLIVNKENPAYCFNLKITKKGKDSTCKALGILSSDFKLVRIPKKHAVFIDDEKLDYIKKNKIDKWRKRYIDRYIVGDYIVYNNILINSFFVTKIKKVGNSVHMLLKEKKL